MQESDYHFFAALFANHRIDGIALNDQEAKKTLERIQQFAHSTPCIYVPTHDPASGNRLAAKKIIGFDKITQRAPDLWESTRTVVVGLLLRSVRVFRQSA